MFCKYRISCKILILKYKNYWIIALIFLKIYLNMILFSNSKIILIILFDVRCGQGGIAKIAWFSPPQLLRAPPSDIEKKCLVSS